MPDIKIIAIDPRCCPRNSEWHQSWSCYFWIWNLVWKRDIWEKRIDFWSITWWLQVGCQRLLPYSCTSLINTFCFDSDSIGLYSCLVSSWSNGECGLWLDSWRHMNWLIYRKKWRSWRNRIVCHSSRQWSSWSNIKIVIKGTTWRSCCAGTH